MIGRLPVVGLEFERFFVTAQTMRRVRQFHLYLGVFFAPAIIFFAFTGAFQTFRLQEEKGWGGPPPQWLVWTAAVHRDSALPQPKPQPKSQRIEKPGDGKPKAAKPKRPSKLPKQIFVTVMSFGLMASAILGVVIAINNRVTRRISVVMMGLGTVLPILLLAG